MAQLPCIGLSRPLTKPLLGSCAIYFHHGVYIYSNYMWAADWFSHSLSTCDNCWTRFLISFGCRTIKFCGGSRARCIKPPLSNRAEQLGLYIYIYIYSRYQDILVNPKTIDVNKLKLQCTAKNALTMTWRSWHASFTRSKCVSKIKMSDYSCYSYITL